MAGRAGRAGNLVEAAERGVHVKTKGAPFCAQVQADRHIVAELHELMSPECCCVAGIGKSFGPLNTKRLRPLPAPASPGR